MSNKSKQKKFSLKLGLIVGMFNFYYAFLGFGYLFFLWGSGYIDVNEPGYEGFMTNMAPIATVYCIVATIGFWTMFRSCTRHLSYFITGSLFMYWTLIKSHIPGSEEIPNPVNRFIERYDSVVFAQAFSNGKILLVFLSGLALFLVARYMESNKRLPEKKMKSYAQLNAEDEKRQKQILSKSKPNVEIKQPKRVKEKVEKKVPIIKEEKKSVIKEEKPLVEIKKPKKKEITKKEKSSKTLFQTPFEKELVLLKAKKMKDKIMRKLVK